jgi:two-component system cell cycle response regulator
MEVSMDREHRSKFYKTIMIASVLYSLFLLIAHQMTREYAIRKGEEKLNDILIYHKALHKYVEEIQKPLFYELKEKNLFPKEYFDARVLSFTYMARNIHSFNNRFREKFGTPTLSYKLASANPRNKLNRATERELRLLEKANSPEGFENFTEVKRINGETHLLYALPVSPNKNSCMRCHGDPKNAPQDLIDVYGDKRGFFEEVGHIRAIISFDLDLKIELDDANKIFWTLSFFALFTIFVILYLQYIYLKRLSKKSEELEKLAVTDSLTGAYNRRKFYDISEIVLQKRGHASIIMFDIDFFKNINDSYGHDAGDRVLQEISSITFQTKDESDIFVRWGGEEFLLFIDKELDIALKLAEELRQRVEKFNFSVDSKITISLGVAHFKENYSIEEVIKSADKALYIAKDTGRNRAVIWRKSD